MGMAHGQSPKTGDALLLIDIQRDFLPGGALAVPGADRILPVVNKLVRFFEYRSLPIVASRDWHPRDHCSFRRQGGTWPVHCVGGTNGAGFPDELVLPENVEIVSKATGSSHDSFSAFGETGLATMLHEKDVTRVYVGGLATEYCVAATVTDAIQSEFGVVVVCDAVGALNQRPGDGERALSRLESLGAHLTMLDQIATDTV